MTDRNLFLFLAEILVLVSAARVGAALAIRAGAPPVTGELLLGILLGPTFFGALWPGGFHALFPPDHVQRSFLELVSWIGVIFLVIVAGLETRFGLLRSARGALVTSWIGGFLVPFGAGFAVALALPSKLVGPDASRSVFALFLATAMSISAIPVIARILLDLELLRTKIGNLILASALADDTVGWVLTSIVVGLAGGRGVGVRDAGWRVGGTLAFIAGALVLGPPLVRWALGASIRLKLAHAQTTVVLGLVVAGGMITQAIGTHLVLGTFVMSILIARSRSLQASSIQAVREIGLGFFAPIFFAYVGVKSDFTRLTGGTLDWALLLLVVACGSKLIGAGLGARLGGLPRWEAAAVGVGLNARGAMELVIASIGLSVGILTTDSYTVLVLIALFTSVMAPPLLRLCLRLAESSSVTDGPTPRQASASLAGDRLVSLGDDAGPTAETTTREGGLTGDDRAGPLDDQQET